MDVHYIPFVKRLNDNSVWITKEKDVFIRYTFGRKYDPDKKYNVPDHKIIGKLADGSPGSMIPNENYLKYFSGTELPEVVSDSKRSSCLRTGAHLQKYLWSL